MRIAVLTQGYYSAGGVQSVARWLVDGLRGRGIEVDVHELGGRPSTLGRTRALAAEEGAVTVWAPRLGASDPVRYLPVPELSRTLDGYDVVQIVAGGPALALSVGRTSTPVVLQVATRMPWERARLRNGSLRERALWLQAQLVGAIEARAVRRADVVLVENPTMGAEVTRLGARAVVIAPPGIDTGRFTPRPGGPARDGYFLSVCRLWDPRKGLDRMIDAYAELVEVTGETRRLVIAGRGTLHPAAKARLAAHDLGDRVEVRPNVPLGELPGLYRGACQFWQTSHEEGLGISALEAMASGLPVIATRTAGSSECVVDGRTGILVDQYDGD